MPLRSSQSNTYSIFNLWPYQAEKNLQAAEVKHAFYLRNAFNYLCENPLSQVNQLTLL